MPCLLKGFIAGHWFDFQSFWAASGVAPLPACCGPFRSGCGSRRILNLVVLLLLRRWSGVRFFRIAGFSSITLSGPLSLWVVGRLGYVYL